MRYLIAFLLVLAFSNSLHVFGKEDKYMQAEIAISGKQLRYFQIASEVLEKNGLKASKYKINLYRFDSSYVVLFEDPSTLPTQRGSGDNMPSFEVEIDLNGRVIKSNFSR